MDHCGFSFRGGDIAYKCVIDASARSLDVTVLYPGGKCVSLSVSGGAAGFPAGGPGGVPQAELPFFSGETVMLRLPGGEEEESVLLSTILPGLPNSAAVTVFHRIDFFKRFSALRVSAWFEGERAVYADALRWLDIRADARTFPSFHGCLPSWEGGTACMTEPLAFRDAVALHDGSDMLAMGNSGRVLVDGGVNAVRLMPFHDLSAFQDDLLLFDRGAPLSAWIVAGPWRGEAALLNAFGTLAGLLHETPEADASGEELSIQSGALKIELIKKPDGVLLKGIVGESGQVADGCAPAVLFRMKARLLRDGTEYALDSSRGWERIDVRQYPDRTRLFFVNPLMHERVRELAVVLECLSEPEGNLVEWTASVLNDNPGVTVTRCGYPELRFGGGEWDVLLPKTSGVLHRDACRHGLHMACPYPAFTAGMPYFAAYRPGGGTLNGVYAAVHDPGGCRKDIRFTSLPGAKCARIRFEYPAPGMGRGANSFPLPGAMAWKLFTGDWYDATMIYREFLLGRAGWVPRRPREGRPDSPEWFREMPFWVMDWLPNGNPDKEPIPVSVRPDKPASPRDWVEKPARLRRELGVPVGYHVYNWHRIPFNNDFPHYFPTEEGFAEGVAELQKAGVRVMPYINGRLWDMLDRRGEDFRFGREALPHAAKDEHGRVLAESYASHEPDKELCRLAVMCPSSWFWRRELEKVVERLFREVGVDAVYIDQIAAAPQEICCDASHNHPPGGGDWWSRAYRELMERLNMQKPEDCAFTTECNAEPYAGSFDGFLTWHWIEAGQVPAFPALYAGTIAMIGRNLNGYKKRDVAYFKHHVAEQLMYGQQIGWINPDVVEEVAKYRFLKKIVRFRWECRELMAEGRLLRPPAVEADLSGSASFAGMGSPPAWDVFTIPPVSSALWLSPNGSVMLIAANVAEKPVACSIWVDTSQCRDADFGRFGVPAGEEAWISGILGERGGICVQCLLPPEGLLALRWDKKK